MSTGATENLDVFWDIKPTIAALKKAQAACEESGYTVLDHFAQMRTMIPTGKGAKRPGDDIHLSRYGAYLTVQNADPEKPIVALGQTYFASQTRKQELAEQFAALPEEHKRMLLRSESEIERCSQDRWSDLA